MTWFAEATVFFLTEMSYKPGAQAKWWLTFISYCGQEFSA
jgi:hypothetical protein